MALLQQVIGKAQDMWDRDGLERVGVIWDAHKLLFQQSAEVQVLQTDLFWPFRQIYFIKMGNIAPSFIVTTSYFQTQK